ncbi:hypothetical protein STSP2_02136 [Anaerohalosphaera lusitana]|uniref:Uncharacterized protein n=1 Tax=Anaerohalosphaera lusitana TaxID=1936003 RepID=A0A1U9NM27_9BACT|nr:hypothetical protein [Anaerohalosphaera lusitana]AQT68959.1 hypothetical protein STSP2_02136 [Anaerohalosphaera lusitana]
MTWFLLTLIVFAPKIKEVPLAPTEQQVDTRYAHTNSHIDDAMADDDPSVSQAELDRRKARNERIAQYRSKYGRLSGRTREEDPQPASNNAQQIDARSLLESKIDFSVFKEDMTVEDAFDKLQESGLPLIVMWRDLERNAFVDKTTTLGVEGNGIIPMKKALDLILKGVSSYDTRLVYVCDGGAVTVATEQADIVKHYLEVYDIAELAGSGMFLNNQRNGRGGSYSNQQGYGNGGYGGNYQGGGFNRGSGYSGR